MQENVEALPLTALLEEGKLSVPKLGSPSQSSGELVKQNPGVHPEDFHTIDLWRGQRICHLRSALFALGANPVTLFRK